MTDLTTIGGMSGVIFGLGGYVWIKCKLDPADGFRLDPTIALIMFAFFLLGFTGIFDAYGTIANFCHAGGLIVGIAWGYASAYKWNRG
jgi:GlpG protein